MTGPTKRFLTKAILGTHMPLRLFVVLGMLLGMLGAIVPGASAGPPITTTTSATFVGGTGTVTADGNLYAKQGGALTLNVVTSSDTKCVEVTGAATLPRQTSSPAKSNWTFTTTAPAGDGAQAFTVAASPNFNNNGCNGQTNSTQASYTLDNTGPVFASTFSPAKNANGWNNTSVIVTSTATDVGGVGVADGPWMTPIVWNSEGTGTVGTWGWDKLGNPGSNALPIWVDKTAPTITATQISAGVGYPTTVTFTCADEFPIFQGGHASGIASCVANGTTTNSKTVTANGTVTGTATDRAGNTSTVSVEVRNVDTTAPTLTGAPTSQPNGAGWYRGDVTVDWTAADAESGIPAAPADTTITGEGDALTSSQTVKNGAGLSTTATSPTVKIDRTAPTTGIGGTSNTWVNGNVTVSLLASDNLSGVASTSYSVNGGAAQAGTSVTLATEGVHTVTFFSTDNAGNAEAAQTATIKIDKTAPTISHAFTPLTYQNGAWTNKDVTVTFTCADQGGSDVASCSAPVTKSTEGSYTVTGTATDGAGNEASDSASVRIDKTAPTITATADGTKNAAGWYKDDVTVTYTASDDASGISSTPTNDVLGEGAKQSASATVTDTAGNSASAGVSGINVDTTAPVLTGTFAGGWHTDDVIVAWTCTDTLSGPTGQPANTTVAGEGDNLSATASCTDVAGNTTIKTVEGIQIDRTAPTTMASVPPVPTSGWYTGAVQVTLTGGDNLAGVAATSYSVDGGATQPYTGIFSFGTEGTHTIAFWSTDNAGNIETAGVPITLSIDTTAPKTTVINPISPESGWFVTSGIPFAFDADDTVIGSGIAATYYTIDGGTALTYGEPFTADLSTGSHKVTYWSVDLAGNKEAVQTLELKVDTIAPTITGSKDPAANGFGWNNVPVTVLFTCSDAESDIASCTAPVTKSAEGAGQSVTGEAQDKAGNTASTTVGDINIDTAKPTVALAGGPVQGQSYYFGSVPAAPTCSASDTLSGLAGSCSVSGYGTTVGSHTVTATATDKAGNTSRVSASYTVKAWTFSNFYQPVDMGGMLNTVKGGSTVPIKFEVFKGTPGVAGTVELINTSDIVQPLKVVPYNCATNVTEDAIELTATGGTVLRYDTTAGQFVYNWQTPSGKAGTCWSVTISAVDGSNQTAIFKLK